MAYKVYWAGRYLERIENVSRMCIMAIDMGKMEEVSKYLGINEKK